MNDRYIFFTGTMRTDYSSGVVTAPNYFDEYVLVGYSGSDQPFLAMVYVSTARLDRIKGDRSNLPWPGR